MRLIQELAGYSSVAVLWSVHAGFGSYVQNLADGRCSAEAGARCEPDGRIHFPAAGVASASSSTPVQGGTELLELNFTGSIEFTGHSGMLALLLAEPTIRQVDDEYLSLSVLSDDGPESRIDMVRLSGPTVGSGSKTGRLSLLYTRVELTNEGVDLFFDQYSAGELFAPVTVEFQRRGALQQER